MSIPKKKEQEQESIKKKAFFYSFGQISDLVSYQTFTFLTFTFYFTIVKINVVLISIGFILWSIWNSLNDPLLGYLSDKTHTKWGRRIPFIMISFVPLSIIMFLLFLPPISFGIQNELTNFTYFIIIIVVFEFFYTMFSLNLTSLFPETFISVKERTIANNIRQTFAIVALIVAFVLPTLFIPDLSNAKYLLEYQFFGITIAIIIAVAGAIFLKYGPRERKEFKDNYKSAPNFIDSIKFCLKSESFRWYIPAEIANWFVYGMLPTIIPLYGKFVLGIGEGESILLALLLGVAFISAALFINILWRPMVQRIGPRKSWLISMSIWIATLVPLMFISDIITGFIVFFLIGIGLSGSLYIIDIIVSDIIDEDEIVTGTRREAGYYGVNALFLRLSTVFVFLAISLVFNNVGWTIFEPEKITPAIQFGLRALIFIFPTIALTIALVAIYKYPLDQERLEEVKMKIKKIHKEKREKIEI